MIFLTRCPRCNRKIFVQEPFRFAYTYTCACGVEVSIMFRLNTVITLGGTTMKALILALTCAALTGCTVSHGVVKDVHADTTGQLVMTKCDVKSYLAFYGLIAADENCREEAISTRATQARR